MSEQSASVPDPAGDAAAMLSRLGADLAAQYPRAAHRGRAEQIAAHAAGLASLLRELAAEEEREAEYEGRLLTLHDAGLLDPANPAHRVQHPDHAIGRLADALARRNGG